MATPRCVSKKLRETKMCVALTKHPGAFFLVSLHCRRISHLKLVAPNSGTTVMNDNNNKVILTSRREAPADQECRWKGCAQKRDEFQSCFFVFKSNFWFFFFCLFFISHLVLVVFDGLEHIFCSFPSLFFWWALFSLIFTTPLTVPQT